MSGSKQILCFFPIGRLQKEEAIKVRVAKADEVSEREKVIFAPSTMHISCQEKA